MEHMYNLTVLPASTAAILITGWCKAKHLNGYFIISKLQKIPQTCLVIHLVPKKIPQALRDLY
jgi:hypothetical protein